MFNDTQESNKYEPSNRFNKDKQQQQMRKKILTMLILSIVFDIASCL